MIRFGIDFGGVIVKRRDTGGDTTLAPQDGVGVAQPGVFEAIGEIVSRPSGSPSGQDDRSRTRGIRKPETSSRPSSSIDSPPSLPACTTR